MSEVFRRLLAAELFQRVGPEQVAHRTERRRLLESVQLCTDTQTPQRRYTCTLWQTDRHHDVDICPGSHIDTSTWIYTLADTQTPVHRDTRISQEVTHWAKRQRLFESVQLNSQPPTDTLQYLQVRLGKWAILHKRV